MGIIKIFWYKLGNIDIVLLYILLCIHNIIVTYIYYYNIIIIYITKIKLNILVKKKKNL